MNFRRLVITCAMSGLLPIAAAYAQTTAAPQAAPPTTEAIQSPQTEGLTEIVVTARRVRENLLKVPVSVTAISPQVIQNRQIADGNDLMKVVPSLNVASPDGRETQYFFIRGIGPAISGDQDVAVAVQAYFNEAPGIASIGSYFDLDNIQVLKGPQGTLFGRNTTAGAVLFETKQPTDKFEGYIDASVGDYGRQQVGGAINIPITEDKVMLRVAGDIFRRDGFTYDLTTHQNLDSRNDEAFRVSLLLKPTDDIESTIIYHHTRVSAPYSSVNTILDPNHEIAPGFPLVALYGPAALANAVTNNLECYPRCTKAGPELQESSFVDWGVQDITKYDVTPNVTLKNIISFDHFQKDETVALDGTNIGLLEASNAIREQTFTEEFQVLGKSFGDRINWVGGTYFEHRQPSGAQQYGIVRVFPPLSVNTHFSDERQTSNAVFGQVTFDLSDWIPHLKATAGVRYTWDDRSLDTREAFGAHYDLSGLCSLADTTGFGKAPVTDPSCELSYRAHFEAITDNFDLDYQITPDTMIYAASRRGYKSGGFNSIAATSAFASFGPEYVTDFETGVKSQGEVSGMQYRATFDGFYDIYHNIQLSTPILINNLITTATLNNGNAHIKGLEFEGTLMPTSWLTLDMFYSLTAPVFTQSPPGPRHLFPEAPRNIVGVSAQVTVPVEGERLGYVVGNIGYTYRTGFWVNNTDVTSDQRIGPYGVIDLSIDWKQVAGRPVDVGFFVTNLADRTYAQDGFPGPELLGVSSKTWGEPRMLGARVKYSW